MVEPDARPVPATQTPEAHPKHPVNLNEWRPVRRVEERMSHQVSELTSPPCWISALDFWINQRSGLAILLEIRVACRGAGSSGPAEESTSGFPAIDGAEKSAKPPTSVSAKAPFPIFSMGEFLSRPCRGSTKDQKQKPR